MSQQDVNTQPAASLFQRAHSKMVMLQRLDTQLGGLLDQRRKVQEELSTIQAQINDEFDRLKKDSEEAPLRLMGTIAQMGAGDGQHAPTPRMMREEAEAAS